MYVLQTIQSPPKGAFSFEDLKWTQKSFRGNPFHIAFVPALRTKHFLVGEEARGHYSFNSKIHEEHKEQPTRVLNQSWLDNILRVASF